MLPRIQCDLFLLSFDLVEAMTTALVGKMDLKELTIIGCDGVRHLFMMIKNLRYQTDDGELLEVRLAN